MPEQKQHWTDEQVETIIADLLRAGVLLAAAVTLIGGVYYLVKNGAALPEYRVFHGEPTELRNLYEIFWGAVNLRSRGLIQLGLLILVATPVARVAFSVFAFARQRDYLYVAITLFVLVILAYSLIGGGL